MDAAIHTEGLTKRFGTRTAVDRLDLDVRPGCVFGFLGPNGAGKTTTIGMLLALITPTAGRAVVLGHDIARAPEQALAAVGAMIEAPAFYPYLSGRDNLRLLALAAGVSPARAEAALDVVELADRAGDKFRVYSQGMRQRLGIAAALLHEPQLIILDEPTNGLDPAGQLEIRELIRTLARAGRTIFVSSHLLHEVEQMCDEVAILKDGRVVIGGTVAELLRRGRGLLVRVAGDPATPAASSGDDAAHGISADVLAQAAALLRGAAWVAGVEQRGDALLVDAPAERAAEITMLLAAHAISVAEIRPVERRLEDFFLEVTRP
ncbi:MAG TPA: ABC transporter ATP-binding protein [Roseiflexaceae bacterium]|nr:ABC transporter ATP-binding protein [Roseiflexaceae bacterium]